MACQFAPASLSSLLDDGVAVLLREGVLRRVERPNGPFSRPSRRAPRSGLVDENVSYIVHVVATMNKQDS